MRQGSETGNRHGRPDTTRAGAAGAHDRLRIDTRPTCPLIDTAVRMTDEIPTVSMSYRQAAGSTTADHRKEHAMSRMIFVNLPVKDLPRSMEFFRALGFTFNEAFTNEQAAAMIVSDQAYVMLVTEPFFEQFSDKSIADSSKAMEVQNAVSAASREEVDQLVQKAIAAGGKAPRPAADEGFMYSRGFTDLDGHQWDFVWMDPSAIPG